MLNDVYLRKAENEGEITEEEKDVLMEFLEIPLDQESIATFLDRYFPHEDSHFDHFLYNLRHYDTDGNLAYKPKKISEENRRHGPAMDFSRFLAVPSFEKWLEAQSSKTKRFPTKEDARRAYNKFKIEKIKQQTQSAEPFTSKGPVKNGGLGDFVTRVGDKKSIWEELTGDNPEAVTALRALTMHQTKLGRTLYDRMFNHEHAEAFQAACAALTSEQLMGSMIGSSRRSNKLLARLSLLDDSNALPHHYWQGQSDLATLETDDIKDRIVRAYTRLFADTMYQVRKAVHDGRRDTEKVQGELVRSIMIGDQPIDKYLDIDGLGSELFNKIDKYLMSDEHADAKEEAGKANLDRERQQRESQRRTAVQKNIKALSLGANVEQVPREFNDADVHKAVTRGEKRAEYAAITRIIDQVAKRHVVNACLNDVSLRAGMGFTTDFYGNTIPRSPMADYLEKKRTQAIIGGDEKGGRDVIRTTQLGDVSEIVGKLYDLVNSISQGTSSVFFRDVEQKMRNRETNWNRILMNWDRLTNREKGIMMNMVTDPRGGLRPMRPTLGGLFDVAARGKGAALPLDDKGEPTIDGKTYIEAFVDHVLESQAKAERRKERDPEDPEHDNQLFTSSNKKELMNYLNHMKVTGEDTDTDSRMSVWKDYFGKECEPVYVKGMSMADRKLGVKNDVLGPENPEDTVEAILTEHSKHKYGEEGRITPVEMIYAHVYDRMQRKDRDPHVDEVEEARHTKDYESIGKNYSLADWLDKENWDSVTGTAAAMGYYSLQGLPGISPALMTRWRKARTALRPTDRSGRERTDSDVLNSDGFKSKYGRFIADFDPTRDSPEEHRCPSCDGSGLKTLPSGRVLRTPCTKCMSTVRQVKETFRSYNNLPEGLLQKWVGCQDPIRKTKAIIVNADSLKLVEQYRKDHARDTERLYSAISRVARQQDVGIISCPECGIGYPERDCKTCNGTGKVVDPMLFAKDVLGSFGKDNLYTQADKDKLKAIERAVSRQIRGTRSEIQDKIEAKKTKGIIPRQKGLQGHEYDRHLFSLLPVMHLNGGPLSMDNLERMFLDIKSRERVDSDSETEERVMEALSRRLGKEANRVLQPEGPHQDYMSNYDVRHFIESQHTQALLGVLAGNAKRDFPAVRIRNLLKKVWDQDIDGNNMHLDDGRFSSGPCSQCNGQHCSKCGYTGREGVRMIISRNPMYANYPPQILQQIEVHRDPDRPTSCLEATIGHVPLGRHSCTTCNHGMAPEIFRGGEGTHSAHLLNPEAVPASALARASTNGVDYGSLSVLTSAMTKLEDFKQAMERGNPEDYRKELAEDAINKIRDALSGEEQRRILKEINENSPLGAQFDLDAMGALARDDEAFEPPKFLSHFSPDKDHLQQKCPHCCKLHVEGLIPKSAIRTLADETAYSREMEETGGELGDATSMGDVICKNMVEAINEKKGGYGNIDYYDAVMSLAKDSNAYKQRARLGEKGMRVAYGIDALEPITEHLTKENLGLGEEGYGRNIDIGGGTMIRLPDVRIPLAKTLLWSRMNDPTMRTQLSKLTGANAIERKESDLQHEHSLFTFLNTLENGMHLPQSKAQDKQLERLYALYILHPDEAPANVLGYRPPALIDNKDSLAQKRVDWAKSVIKSMNDFPVMYDTVSYMRDHFSHLAPLLRLEEHYKNFRHTPLGSIRKTGPLLEEEEGDILPESILDSKWRTEQSSDSPFLDMRPDSPLAKTMGVLRIHSVNLSEFVNYAKMNQDQFGFLTPFEHHPSLEYLLNPNLTKTIDPTIISAWMRHAEDELPEVMKMEGKSWDEILDARFEDETLSDFSFPGLLWEYATGGHHEHGGDGGWPDPEDLVGKDGSARVDAHLIQYYHYIAKEMKLRADNPEGSTRLMEKSLTRFPMMNANEFGRATRCLVCRGSNHGTISLGLAMHLKPRLEFEQPNDKVTARPFVKDLDDGSLKTLYPDENGQYDFTDPDVVQYILDNLAPFGHEPGEDNWRKVYDDHMKHGDVPYDEAGEPLPFEKWLPLQSAECVSCKGGCSCSSCDGHGHSEMSPRAREAQERLLLGMTKAYHNMVGLIDTGDSLEYHPDMAEVEPLPVDPLYPALAHILDRENELDMALRSLKGPDGQIIGLTGGIEQFRAMLTHEQIQLVDAFKDELAHLFAGDPIFDTITRPDEELDGMREQLVKAGLAPGETKEEMEDQQEMLRESMTNQRDIRGFFSGADVWRESQRRRIVGGYHLHRALVEGPHDGEDLYLTDENGEPMYAKDKDGKPDKDRPLVEQRFGFDASKVRMYGGPLQDESETAAVPLLDSNGNPVITRVKSTGKGLFKNEYNRMEPGLKKKLDDFVADKREELVEQRMKELGIEKESGLSAQDKKDIRRAIMNAVRSEQERDEDGRKNGVPIFFGNREHDHFVPLLVNANGQVETVLDRENWIRPLLTMTEDDKIQYKKYQQHMNRMKQQGWVTTIEGKDPNKSRYLNAGWDTHGLANPIGKMETNLHKTSSYVRGRTGVPGRADGSLGHGNHLGWNRLLKDTFRRGAHTEEELRQLAGMHIKELSHEQYWTPYSSRAGAKSQHSHFVKIPQGEEDEKTGYHVADALSQYLRNRNYGGVEVSHASTSGSHNIVIGRTLLRQRLEAMARGGNAISNIDTGVTICKSCSGQQILQGNLCPACHGHGYIPRRDAEGKEVQPIVRYDKITAAPYHTKQKGVSIKSDKETFKDALRRRLITLQERRIQDPNAPEGEIRVINRFKEVPRASDHIAMIMKKVNAILDDNFRLIKPHHGWGARVGHNVPRMKRFGGDITFTNKGLDKGWGDGFLALARPNEVQEFIKKINALMSESSPWDKKYADYKRLAEKHIEGWEEGEEGAVRKKKGVPTHVISGWASPETWMAETSGELQDEIDRREKAGDASQAEGSIRKTEYDELKELNKLVINMTQIKLGMFNAHRGDMAIRQDKDTPFGKKAFQESKEDSVHFLPADQAQALLDLMDDGAPFVRSNLPLGHGGNINIALGRPGSDSEKENYREKVIGNRSIGMSPDERIEELHRIVGEGQKGIMANRMTYTPRQASEILNRHGDPKTASITREELIQLAKDLDLEPAYFLPYEHEVKGKTPEELRLMYRDQYAKMRSMGEEAYDTVPHSPAMSSIYDYAQEDMSRVQIPDETNVQTSFDAPLDSAFFILKNII